MVSELDIDDRQLSNVLQSSFPLVEEPFEEIGRGLGLSGHEVIRRVDTLKGKHVVRQISAIFDTRRLVGRGHNAAPLGRFRISSITDNKTRLPWKLHDTLSNH